MALFLGYLMTWWLRAEIDSLGQQKLMLAAEISQMEKTAQQLEGKGGKGEVTKCGARERLCVRVDEKAGGFGEKGEGKVYRVIWGY